MCNDHCNFRVCMLQYGSYLPDALAASTHQSLSALGKKMDFVPLKLTAPYYNAIECLDRAVTGTHAMIETESYLRIMVESEGQGDKTYFLKDDIYEGAVAFFFRKNTPWKYKFDEGILSLLESGFIKKWFNDINRQLRGKRRTKVN